jgi:HK97 family phage major capsid protein
MTPPETGVMVAFLIPDEIARQLRQIPAGTDSAPVDLLHITLAYLGDATEIAEQKSAIIQAVTAFAQSQPPLAGMINGTGRFVDQDPGAVYLNFDSPALPDFREDLMDALAGASCQPNAEHGFTPHITIAYIPASAPTPDIALQPMVVAFGSVALCWGDEILAFDLAGTQAMEAAEDAAEATEDMMKAASEEAQPVETKSLYTTIDTARPTTTVKALDETGDRVGGYLVVWGSPNQKDLQGEYFTPGTEFCLEWYPKRPALYHHGQDAKAQATLIGTIDTIEADDIGLWAEAQLTKRNKYADAVRELVAKGALAWSSGTTPGLAVRGKGGQITRWPIIEGSLTPTPAEPRYTGISHIAPAKAVAMAYKALNIPADRFLLPEQDDEPGGAQDSARLDNASQEPAAAIKSIPTVTAEKKKMDPEELKKLIGAAVADAMQPKENPLQKQLDEMNTQLTHFKSLLEGKGEGAQPLPNGGTKTLPVPQNADRPGDSPRIEVIRATKYSDLSASDMAFFAELMMGTNDANHKSSKWNPDQAFARELADKSVKAVARGELPASAIKGLSDKMGGAIKSNELDNVGQAGFGLEWAPDSWRAELWLRTRQDNVVAPLFQMIEMPTNPYELPIESSDPTVYYVPETTDQSQLVLTSANPIPESKTGSGKVQMSAKKVALRMAWSAELNEDSLIPVIANYKRQSIRAMQNAIDNLILNGDAATGASVNVNLIDGTPTSGTKYLAFNGLRKYCLVTNTAQKKDASGTPTLPLLRATRFLMAGQYALRPRDCAWIVDDSVYARLLNMPEFLTMDKAGANATNLSGQIGVMDGVPVFASAEYGLTDATGKISGTPSNNKYGQAVIVFRPNWLVGYRRQVNAQVEYFSWIDAYHLVVTARVCLVSFSGDTQSAAELYDLTV